MANGAPASPRVSIPHAVRELLAQIATLAEDHDLEATIYDQVTAYDLAEYYIWQDAIKLAAAYGRGEEDEYFRKLEAEYGIADAQGGAQ